MNAFTPRCPGIGTSETTISSDREIGVRESLWLSAGCIGVAVLFGAWLWHQLGADKGLEYFTGYLVVFAVDSVPAIFAITADPFIAYTSNIFAILGLRAMYFALAAAMHRFAYLKAALALVLVFIGGKTLLLDLTGKLPASVSRGVTGALIAGGVLVSLWKTRTNAPVALRPGSTAPASRSRTECSPGG